MGTIREFALHLGTVEEFVTFLRNTEQTGNFSLLNDLDRAPINYRYLLVRRGRTRVIDFKHFFAAMAVRLGFHEELPSLPRGLVLFLGDGNEASQCIDETLESLRHRRNMYDSCISFEDIPSNEHGATFADLLAEGMEHRLEPIPHLPTMSFRMPQRIVKTQMEMAVRLERYLFALDPIPSREILWIRSLPGSVYERTDSMIPVLHTFVRTGSWVRPRY
ncbi:MAG: hypothetical protein SFW35_13685 [Chitinophagales bacterium]|nr:hypothetical protein [Chitinophagales bacterium]